jgi:hypothetical protein
MSDEELEAAKKKWIGGNSSFPRFLNNFSGVVRGATQEVAAMNAPVDERASDFYSSGPAHTDGLS